MGWETAPWCPLQYVTVPVPPSQEQQLRETAKPALQTDYSEWQNPNTSSDFLFQNVVFPLLFHWHPTESHQSQQQQQKNYTQCARLVLESSIIRNKLNKISWGDTSCCPCAIKRSNHMVLQAAARQRKPGWWEGKDTTRKGSTQRKQQKIHLCAACWSPPGRLVSVMWGSASFFQVNEVSPAEFQLQSGQH